MCLINSPTGGLAKGPHAPPGASTAAWPLLAGPAPQTLTVHTLRLARSCTSPRPAGLGLPPLVCGGGETVRGWGAGWAWGRAARAGGVGLGRRLWGGRGGPALAPPSTTWSPSRRPCLPTLAAWAIWGWEWLGCRQTSPRETPMGRVGQRCSQGLAEVPPPGPQRERQGPRGWGSMGEIQGHSGVTLSTPGLIYGGHR